MIFKFEAQSSHLNVFYSRKTVTVIWIAWFERKVTVPCIYEHLNITVEFQYGHFTRDDESSRLSWKFTKFYKRIQICNSKRSRSIRPPWQQGDNRILDNRIWFVSFSLYYPTVPAGTLRRRDVLSTLMKRHYVASMLIRRHVPAGSSLI